MGEYLSTPEQGETTLRVIPERAPCLKNSITMCNLGSTGTAGSIFRGSSEQSRRRPGDYGIEIEKTVKATDDHQIASTAASWRETTKESIHSSRILLQSHRLLISFIPTATQITRSNAIPEAGPIRSQGKGMSLIDSSR